jgi:S-methyl-5-thioribose-1-phosphate isomerase
VGRGDLEPAEIVRFEEDGPTVVLLDQRRLPDEVVELECRTVEELVVAIRELAVRGAPAIGIAAAYGVALAAARGDDLDAAAAALAASRPTAVNLTWALAEMQDDPSAAHARRLHEEEVARCRAMAAHAAELFGPGTRALTHCNAGGLATGGYGSAVGALRAAWERGLLAHVWVDETRPLLQGSRLTAWELETAGIPHAVIADSAAASLMAAGEVDCVVTGADRIAANGDTANKIGTYSLAVLAAHHDLPFYVVAPTSTIDLDTPTGADIPIEERSGAAGGADRRDRDGARRPSARRAMKVLILAAGYATRLRPLTDTIPKQLLPVGGRPMVDWILDRVAETSADEVHLVTNARFAADFERWADGKDVRVHNDGTTSNEDRLGAIGDIEFVGLDDDLLAIAGDNLFDYSLAEYETYWREKGGSCVAVHDVGDLELARQYGIVDVDADDRIVGFVEKPERPASTLAATATYLYRREHAALVPEYLAAGNPPDQPGNFIGWLYERQPTYAYRFSGEWYDIGDQAQLLEADNRMRRRAGLPERAVYSPS